MHIRALGNTRKVVIAVGIALTVRLTGFAAQSAAADDMAFNYVQYAIPIAAIIGALVVIWWRKPKPRREPQAVEEAVA